MKTILKLSVVFAVIFLGFIGILHYTHAAGLPTQLVSSTQFGISSPNGGGSYYELYHVGAGTVLTSLTFLFDNATGTPVLGAIQDDSWTSGLDASAHCADAGSWTVVTSTNNSTSTFWTYILDTPYTFTCDYMKAYFSPGQDAVYANVSPYGIDSSTSTDNVAGLITYGLPSNSYVSHDFEMYICTNLNCSLPPLPAPVPVVNFLYPTDGTTSPPFSPWLFSVSGLSATHTYNLTVHWQRPNQACGSFNTQNFCPIFSDSIQGFYGATTGTVPIVRPDRNLQYDNDGKNEDLWNAKAYLSDVTVPVYPFAASSSIQFTLLRYLQTSNNGSTNFGTSTYVFPTVSATGTIYIQTTTNMFFPVNNQQSPVTGTSTCPNDTLGLCGVVSFLFDPRTFPEGQTFFSDQLNTLKAIPLLSPVFQTLDVVSSTANAFSSSTSSGLSIGIVGYTGQQVDLVDVNSTTFYHFASDPTDAKIKFLWLSAWGIAWLWIAAAIKLWWIMTHSTTA